MALEQYISPPSRAVLTAGWGPAFFYPRSSSSLVANSHSWLGPSFLLFSSPSLLLALLQLVFLKLVGAQLSSFLVLLRLVLLGANTHSWLGPSFLLLSSPSLLIPISAGEGRTFSFCSSLQTSSAALNAASSGARKEDDYTSV